MKQRGIISYGISPNRQNPLAGTAHDAVFNTFRRVSSQFLYWAPSLVAGYYIMNWAVERYVASPPPTAPKDFDHGVAKEGPLLSSFKRVPYSNRGFCWLVTTTSTRRPVVLSSLARRSKRWTLRYLGTEPGCSSRERELVLNRLTCISPSLFPHGSNWSWHRQDMDLFYGYGHVLVLDLTRYLKSHHQVSPCSRSAQQIACDFQPRHDPILSTHIRTFPWSALVLLSLGTIIEHSASPQASLLDDWCSLAWLHQLLRGEP